LDIPLKTKKIYLKLVLLSSQKLTSSLLATITLEVATLRTYALLQCFCQFLNAFWKVCSVRVFSSACDSASITTVVSKWRPFSFIFNGRNRKVGRVGDDIHVVFGQKFPGRKGNIEIVCCHDAAASSFVVKVWGEVFAPSP
jgi:hypothetical protein